MILFNVDNILSYQWSPNLDGWVIQSRDITDTEERPLQANPNPEPVFSFAFFRPTIVVTTADDENDSNPFEDSGDISLREAISQGTPESLILFDATLDGKTINLDLGELAINNSLTIDASNLPNGLTIDAGGQSRVMDIQPGAIVALHGLTLTGGNSPLASGGACIRNNSSSLSLSACTLSGNTTGGQGGAIFSRSTSSSATVSLSACTIHGNSSGGDGGGVYASDTILNVSNCTVSGNSSGENGGGILNFGGSGVLNLSDTIVAGNAASERQSRHRGSYSSPPSPPSPATT